MRTLIIKLAVFVLILCSLGVIVIFILYNRFSNLRKIPALTPTIVIGDTSRFRCDGYPENVNVSVVGTIIIVSVSRSAFNPFPHGCKASNEVLIHTYDGKTGNLISESTVKAIGLDSVVSYISCNSVYECNLVVYSKNNPRTIFPINTKTGEVVHSISQVETVLPTTNVALYEEDKHGNPVYKDRTNTLEVIKRKVSSGCFMGGEGCSVYKYEFIKSGNLFKVIPNETREFKPFFVDDSIWIVGFDKSVKGYILSRITN